MSTTMLNSANQFFPIEVYSTSQPYVSMRMIKIAHIVNDQVEPVIKMDIYLCHLSVIMNGGDGSSVVVRDTGLSGFWASPATSFGVSPTADFPAGPNQALVLGMQEYIENGEDIFVVHARFSDGDLTVSFPSRFAAETNPYQMSVNQTFLAAKIL